MSEALARGRLLATASTVAHPWLCDVMGHMNTRHIFAAFDDAGFILLDRLGFPVAAIGDDADGWADVHVESDLQREIPVGTVLQVLSGIERIGRTSFTHVHRLVSGATQAEHARATITTVRFDVRQRKAVQLPPPFVRAAGQWLGEPPTP